MRRTDRFFGICVVTLLIFASALAQQTNTRTTGRDLTADRVITFNGTLKDSNGLPRLGNFGITLSLYASQEGGIPLWQESQSVQTDEEGRYTVLLGATVKEGLPLDVFGNGKAQWLGVQVQGEEEQSRVLLVAVPYALKAADADTVGGKSLSSFVLYEDLAKVQEKVGSSAVITVPGAYADSSGGTKSGLPDGATGTTGKAGVVAQASSGGPVPVFGNEVGNNTYYGQYAGASLSLGSTSNSFFGYNSGTATTSADFNSFFGGYSGYLNTTGNENTMVGLSAGYGLTTGSLNTAVGEQAGRMLGGGSSNSLFGQGAGYNNTASENSFFGTQSGNSNTSGTTNSFFGFQSGYSNTTGYQNDFFGYKAGRANTTAIYNSFYGALSGLATTTGPGNAFFGTLSGTANTTGGWNTFVGAGAGDSNTTANYNSFYGNSAGGSNTSGTRNAFIGMLAGYDNTIGNDNSFLGYYAGYTNTSGSQNTFAGAYSDGQTGISNATALGYRAKVTQSNSLVLGSISGVNGASTSTNVGIGTTAPKARLDVIGPIYSSAWGPLTGSGLALLYDQAGAGTGLLLSYDSVADHALDFAFRASTIDLRSGYYGNTSALYVDPAGRVGLGTKTPTERLQIVGNLKVSGNIIYGAPEEPVPDYVFDSDYKLMPIEELQKYVQEQRHLPNVPNAGEIRENGINLGDFQLKLLQKIEELTLYTVQQATTIREQDNSIRELKARLAALEKNR